MLDEYRQRFRDFTITLIQAEYWRAIGREHGPNQVSIYREHSDLFSSENIAELRRQHNEINEHRETAREEIHRLIAFAIRGYLVLAGIEISNEISRSRSQARIDWNAQQIELDPRPVVGQRVDGFGLGIGGAKSLEVGGRNRVPFLEIP